MAKSKNEIVVDPEFASLMPPQTEEEVEKLHAQLLAQGCLDALKGHKETGILLDGHTRKKFCDKNEIEYRVEWVSIKGADGTPEGDRDAALDWMIQYQLGRRNLTELQKSVLRGREYNRMKKAVGRPVKPEETFALTDGTDDTHEGNGTLPEANGHTDTASVLAAKYNVGSATIERDADLARAVDKMPVRERTEFLRGKSDLTKGQVIKQYGPKKKDRAKAAPKSKKKAGAAKFPWTEWAKTYDRLVRATDEIGKSYDSKNSNEHRTALRLLSEYDEKVKEWRKRFEAKEVAK